MSTRGLDAKENNTGDKTIVEAFLQSRQLSAAIIRRTGSGYSAALRYQVLDVALGLRLRTCCLDLLVSASRRDKSGLQMRA